MIRGWSFDDTVAVIVVIYTRSGTARNRGESVPLKTLEILIAITKWLLSEMTGYMTTADDKDSQTHLPVIIAVSLAPGQGQIFCSRVRPKVY